MMNPKLLLFSILRSALIASKLCVDKLTHKELQILLQLAEKQTVEGLVVGALMRENVRLERGDALTVFSKARSIEQVNHRMNEEVVRLERLLSNNHISHLIFKGQTLAQLYSHPEERIPGDIDFFCDRSDFDKAVNLIRKSWNVDIHFSESEQHCDFMHENVPLEMHFKMIHFNNSAIMRYWETLLDEESRSSVVINDVDVPTLNPTLNVLYTFLHLYHHLVELGVGLRQFVDVFQLLHRFRDEIDRAALEKHLQAMGFRNAFCAIGWILVYHLGLPADEFPLDIRPQDKKYEKQILSIVFTGGNFGKSFHQNGVRSSMGYYIKALRIKLSHYRLFWHLSKREILSTMLKELPKKFLLPFRG